jgi:16S rRNA (guanine(966)-N(2))-methyltransferase RsmD
MQTRPTLSRVRESLFSIIGSRIVDADVLDLYAGAGALGLEALSRGAAHCVFVDRAASAIAALKQNVARLRYESVATIISADVQRWLKQPAARELHFDVIFSDAPYNDESTEQTLREITAHLDLAQSPLIVLQCGSRETTPDNCGDLHRTRSERYGDTAVHFYEAR